MRFQSSTTTAFADSSGGLTRACASSRSRLASALLVLVSNTAGRADDAVNSGYDGSLMNGLLSMPLFVTSIGNPDGNKLGIISAAYSLGTIIGVVFASYLADRLGRKLTICK